MALRKDGRETVFRTGARFTDLVSDGATAAGVAGLGTPTIGF
jgi:hypothetical protein